MMAEVWSLHFAATFAYIIAVFIGGPRISKGIYYLASVIYLFFSVLMYTFLAAQLTRVSALNTLILKSDVEADLMSEVAGAYVYSPTAAAMSAGVLAFLSIATVTATAIIYRRAQRGDGRSDEGGESTNQGT